MRKLTSERVRKEFAEQTRHLPGGHMAVPKVEKAVVKKPSFIKRHAMSLVLAMTVSVGSAIVMDSLTVEYDGVSQVTICWDCSSEEGVYNSPEAAIKAINPHANEKEIAFAEEEFIAINKLPHKYYNMYLQAGEYDIPVIK